MILGFKASCWPFAIVGSVGRKVPSVAERPGRPNSKLMVGVQVPNKEALAARAWLGIKDAVAAVAASRERRRVVVCIFTVLYLKGVERLKTGRPIKII
jgi:hypothetical protein